MLLHVDESGRGDRVALLVHGMMGSAESWWRVALLLVDRGYRVIAVDLPGHGLSPRDRALTIERAADTLIETIDHILRKLSTRRVASAVDGSPHLALAIGHSFGGLVLAAAAPRLQPELAVYVDSPFTSRGGHDRVRVTADYESDRLERTYERLRETRPHYSERDCEVEAVAASRFDAATGAAVAAAGGGTWPPASGSIVVRPDPSHYVTDADAEVLTARGVTVRSIPGAAHSVWYSHFDAFVDALPEVFGEQ